MSHVQLIEDDGKAKKITLLSLWENLSNYYYSICYITKCVNIVVIEPGPRDKTQICKLIDQFYEM